jgi:tetratricopeptide (TPR) repeat protein
MQENSEEVYSTTDLHLLFASESPSKDQRVLEKIARFGEFLEKTPHWYTGYGLLLKTAERYDAAISQFQQAVDLDKNSWKALEGLSRSYAALEEYENGTTLLQQALAVVPETFKPAVREIRTNLIEVMIKKGDFHASLQYAKAAYEEEPANKSFANVYARSLYALGDYKQIVEVARSIQATKESVFAMLSSTIEEVCRACVDQHCPDLISSEFRRFLVDTSPLIPYLAIFMLMYCETPDEAIRLLERSLNPTVSDTVLPQFNQMHTSGVYIAKAALSEVYYQKATDEIREGRDPTEWGNKLKDLALNSKDVETVTVEYMYSLSTAALAYGIYLRKYAKAEPETWMPWLRAPLLLALDMLCDDDPGNDLDAYKRCIINLIAAGDFANAQAAAAVCLMPLSMTDNSWLAAARELHFAKHVCTCDGLCKTDGAVYNVDYKELLFCTECIDTSLCEACHQKLMDSELPIRICNPRHEFLRVFPVPEEAKGVAARFDGEKMIVQQEWLDGLRKKWT